MRSKLTAQDFSDGGQLNNREILYQRTISYIADKGLGQHPLRNVKRYFVQVDGAQKEPFRKNWMELINIGRASDLLKAKVQEQILDLRDNLGFRYVRFWSLFHREMELRMDHQTNVLNFDRIDEVLDFLVYNNLLPFIELGDKPIQIVRSISDYVKLDEGNPVFYRLSEYKTLLTHFFHHIITRYRADRVRQWRFECWFDEGKGRQHEPISFFDMFNITCEVIRSILPDAVIGGCGMKCNDVRMEAFLNSWKEQPYQPDFFSVISYPYDPVAAQESTYDDYVRQSTDSDFMLHQIRQVKEFLRTVGMDIPVYVTEWNCTVSSRNYINDSCYKGVYLMNNITNLLGEVDVLGYWSGLDLVNTYYDSSNILSGCPGLLTKDNICKPAYYAFRFLQRMGAYLVESNKNYLITTSGHFSYYIICYNYHPLNRRYYQKPEHLHTSREIQTLTTDGIPMHMSFQLDHLSVDQYAIKTYAISPHYGSVLDEWIRLNTMTNMREEDIDYLKRICTPHMSIQEMEATNGTLRFELELEPAEMALIHIYRKY